MFTESAEIYDAIYQFKDYHAEAGRVAALIRQANPQARSILDVACGTGEHARWLASDHGFEVAGIDLDDVLLAVARRKVPQGQFICADMESLSMSWVCSPWRKWREPSLRSASARPLTPRACPDAAYGRPDLQPDSDQQARSVTNGRFAPILLVKST